MSEIGEEALNPDSDRYWEEVHDLELLEALNFRILGSILRGRNIEMFMHLLE